MPQTLMNPSHVLIARSSRPSQQHATLSSPLETHAAASGVFPRNSSSPPIAAALYNSDDNDSEDGCSSVDYHEPDEPMEVDPTFRENATFPGTVKITVGASTFWAHKEILFFASPFFEAALSGHWLETGRPASIASSVITISQPPSFPEDSRSSSTARHNILHSSSSSNPNPPNPGSEQDDFGVFHMSEDEDSGTDGCDKVDDSTSGKAKDQARHQSLQQLEGSPVLRKPSPKIDRSRRGNARPLDAHIELKEEKARTFHDFLKFVYPHLDCVITWNNVEGLMNISHKLVVPALQTACLHFLLSHAAGKPIKAMRIAELFNEDELYRESSRFVLDNPGGWPETEMRTLSQETLLKLEKRRNWFLERVLKLGLVTIAKEYQCCATCPDPPNCARLLDEKWRQNYHALFRFGPAQPSMVFRYLRQLEGVSPPLGLTHYSCQLAAKIWVSTLFDRMFSLGIRNSTDLVLPDPRVPNAGPGPRRHFLYCSLHDDNRKSIHRPRNAT